MAISGAFTTSAPVVMAGTVGRPHSWRMVSAPAINAQASPTRAKSLAHDSVITLLTSVILAS